MTTNDVSDTRVSTELLRELIAEFEADVAYLTALEAGAGSAPSKEQVEQARNDVEETRSKILASRHPQPVNEPAEWQVEAALAAAHKMGAAINRPTMLTALRAASIPAPEHDHTTEYGKALDAIRRKAIAFGTRATDGYAEIQAIACDALNVALTKPPAPERSEEETAEDEAYEIGKRDGYAQAVQDIDLRTGGDGEYRFCTDHDPDRHTPTPAHMIERIVDRFSALRAASIPAPERSKEEAVRVKVKPLEWEATEDEMGRNGWRWRGKPAVGLAYIISVMVHGQLGERYEIASRTGNFASLEEAKAAAQADYEQRILSALETPPLHKEGEAIGYVSQTTLAHLKVGTSAVACSIYGAPVSIHKIPLYAAPAPVPVTITPDELVLRGLITEARMQCAHPNVHFHYSDGPRVMSRLADALEAALSKPTGEV